jgi:hypothetical protein
MHLAQDQCLVKDVTEAATLQEGDGLCMKLLFDLGKREGRAAKHRVKITRCLGTRPVNHLCQFSFLVTEDHFALEIRCYWSKKSSKWQLQSWKNGDSKNYLFFFFLFAVLGMESRASHMLSKYSTNELSP